jgi:hypothetical protein
MSQAFSSKFLGDQVVEVGGDAKANLAAFLLVPISVG